MPIRYALTEDLPVILDIMNDAILNSTAIYDYHERTMEYATNWFSKKHKDGLPVIVYEKGDTVTGFGSYGIFRPWDGYRFTAEHSIYVAKEYRGQGMGGALLEELIALARTQNFHTLIAGIDAENKESCAFHARHGFVEVGRFREVGYKFDRWLDLVFMQLLL